MTTLVYFDKVFLLTRKRDPTRTKIYRTNLEERDDFQNAMDQTLEKIKEQKINLSRGNICVITIPLKDRLNYYRNMTSLINLIFDGTEYTRLINRSKDAPYEIPKEFSIDEFGIHYWDNFQQEIYRTLDHTPYRNQMISNLKSTEDFGKFNEVIYSRGSSFVVEYSWTNFIVPYKHKECYFKSDASCKLIKDIDNIILQYLIDVYCVIFVYFDCPRNINKVIDAINNDSEIKFTANVKMYRGNNKSHREIISNEKLLKLYENIMYVGIY